MKIYIAGPQVHNIKQVHHVLFSYYDIVLSDLCFRKDSWTIMVENKKEEIRNDTK